MLAQTALCSCLSAAADSSFEAVQSAVIAIAKSAFTHCDFQPPYTVFNGLKSATKSRMTIAYSSICLSEAP